jgi:lipoprotein-releasing system permease protein
VFLLIDLIRKDKKFHSPNVINIISAISVLGVSVGTMALIVILSVFNGFEGLIKSLFNSFDPDIRITIVEGKTFIPEGDEFDQIKNTEGVVSFSETIEEHALLRYDDQQHIATIKGVSNDYARVSGVDSMIIEGQFMLWDRGGRPCAIIGAGVQYYLSIGLNFINPLFIYIPKKNTRPTVRAFNRKDIYPKGVFSVEKETDSRFVIVPLQFARELLEYDKEVSAIELKLDPTKDADKIQQEIKTILGPEYNVKNRFEQKEFFYKVMKTEKWAIFFILTFILIVASFNIIGSLTMLIIDKKNDMFTLRSIGADLKFIRRIFFLEGWLISLVGAFIGLLLGFIICWVQQTFGLLKLYGANSFIVNAYPVEMQASDFLHVLVTVVFLGIIAAWHPVRYITKKHLVEFN